MLWERSSYDDIAILCPILDQRAGLPFYFENRYGMSSATFYDRFEAGKLGDAMDFFEWAGLYELRQDILKKIRRLESGS